MKPRKKLGLDFQGQSTSKIGRSAASKRSLVDSDTESAARKRAAVEGYNLAKKSRRPDSCVLPVSTHPLDEKVEVIVLRVAVDLSDSILYG